MKAILMIAVLFVSVSALAENVRSQFKYEYQQARDAHICALDANYCKVQQELKQLYKEQYNANVQLRAVKNIAKKACEDSQVRKQERSEFDPIANRFPVKTQCTEIPEVQAILAQSQVMARSLNSKIQYLNDRIMSLEVLSADLAAKVE